MALIYIPMTGFVSGSASSRPAKYHPGYDNMSVEEKVDLLTEIRIDDLKSIGMQPSKKRISEIREFNTELVLRERSF